MSSYFITYCTLYVEHNWEDLCILNQGFNKRALLVTIVKSGEVRFLQMPHRRFSIVTQASFCNCN